MKNVIMSRVKMKSEENTQVPLTRQYLEKSSLVPATHLPLEPISSLMKILHQSTFPKHEELLSLRQIEHFVIKKKVRGRIPEYN